MSNINDNQLLPRIIIKYLPQTNPLLNQQRNVEHRSIGCNTELIKSIQTSEEINQVNTLTNLSFQHIINEAEEEDKLIEVIGQLIHKYLSRPSRCQPYRMLFKLTNNTKDIQSYNVLLQIEQELENPATM